MLQGLLFWLIEEGLKVSSGSYGTDFDKSEIASPVLRVRTSSNTRSLPTGADTICSYSLETAMSCHISSAQSRQDPERRNLKQQRLKRKSFHGPSSLSSTALPKQSRNPQCQAQGGHSALAAGSAEAPQTLFPWWWPSHMRRSSEDA